MEAGDLGAEEIDVAAVPAVADDQRDRAAAEDAAGPVEVEGVQRVADARAVRPVRDDARDLGERAVEIALAELPAAG